MLRTFISTVRLLELPKFPAPIPRDVLTQIGRWPDGDGGTIDRAVREWPGTLGPGAPRKPHNRIRDPAFVALVGLALQRSMARCGVLERGSPGTEIWPKKTGLSGECRMLLELFGSGRMWATEAVPLTLHDC